MTGSFLPPVDVSFVPWVDALTGQALGQHEATIGDLAFDLAALGRDHDLTLEVCHDLGLYAALQAVDSRLSYSPIVNPAYNHGAGPDDVAIMVLRRGRAIVGVYGVAIRWVAGKLSDRIDDMSVICRRPDLLPRGDSWSCTADIAEEICNCHVALGMSIWTDQATGAHERTVAALLTRMMILWSYAERRWSWFVGFATAKVAPVLSFARYGAEGLQEGVTFTHNGKMVPTFLVYASRQRYARQLRRTTFTDLTMPLTQLPPEQAA